MLSEPSAPAPPPGPHGGDSWRVAAALGVDASELLDLSASTNPFAPDVTATLRSLLDRHPELVTRYPDDTTATRALADALGEDPDRVVLTNGGAEAIALVAHLEGAGEVCPPEFGLYARHLPRVDPGAPRWRSNPSNPLGRLARDDEEARVWDEAFFPLATGRWTRGDRASWRLGSLTKLWACPGLRLGYAIAPSPLDAMRLRDLQPRWSVNALAAAVVPRLLARTDLVGWSKAIASLRAELSGELQALGFTVEETDANWILVHRRDLRADLLRCSVLVRDCASFGLEDVARVALPPPQALDRVIGAFARVGP